MDSIKERQACLIANFGAGFCTTRANKVYATIISIPNKLPGGTLQEDEKLLTLYHLVWTRTEES
jgi:hypothetical protein